MEVASSDNNNEAANGAMNDAVKSGINTKKSSDLSLTLYIYRESKCTKKGSEFSLTLFTEREREFSSVSSQIYPDRSYRR